MQSNDLEECSVSLVHRSSQPCAREAHFMNSKRWTVRHARNETMQSNTGVIKKITELGMMLDKENFYINSTIMVCIYAINTMRTTGKIHLHTQNTASHILHHHRYTSFVLGKFRKSSAQTELTVWADVAPRPDQIQYGLICGRGQLKYDGTHAETKFRLYGRVHVNRRGCQFNRVLATEVCASVVVCWIHHVPKYCEE